MRLSPLILFLGLVAAGCGGLGGGSSVDADHPSTLALVFVDVSKSTYGKGGIQRQRYLAAFDRVVHALGDGTLLKADIIDVNPLSDSSLPISEFYEKYEGITGKKNQFQIAQQHKHAAEEAIAQFRALLKRRPTGDSILDSLNIAQDVNDAYSTAKTRYLIVFSDMIETSQRYRFTDANLRPDRVAAFIRSERKSGDLPTLSGVEVYVVGAGATRGADAKPSHIRAIKNFWLTYFRAAGAILPSYRYSPTLIKFP